MDRSELLTKVRRLVVKIGTASLSKEQGGLDETQVERLATQVQALRQKNIQVTIVSSGAIGAGMNAFGLKRRPTNLPALQACAAVGQGRLTALYDNCFRKGGFHAAQVLLTRDDFHHRRRYLNAYNTLQAIACMGAVPVINENDTISVEEIDLTFGDNDRLAALVASLLGADMLILLTDVEGLYEDPGLPAAQRRVVPVVEKVTDEVRQMATSSKSRGGRGGMTSKIEAARIATASGAATLIAGARQPKILERLFEGEELGTLFLPNRRRLSGHKRWLRFGTRTSGHVVVDAGARKALAENGKSLLPSGIKDVRGEFDRGELVSVCDESGAEFACGLVNFGSEDIRKIMGQKTTAVRRILGEAAYDEVIHRDHLALSE